MFHNTKNGEQAIYMCSKALWALGCVISNVSSLILFVHNYPNSKQAWYNQKIHMAHQSILYSTYKAYYIALTKHCLSHQNILSHYAQVQILSYTGKPWCWSLVCNIYVCLSLGWVQGGDITSVHQYYARLWVLWFRTMLSQASHFMDHGPSYNISCIYYLCHGLHAKWIRKIKVVIHLDKSLSNKYSNEVEICIMNVALLVVINVTANEYVSILGNAVVWLNANMYHGDLQKNNWE